MFLKRIEMQGFKSFADRTIIQFDHPITGIVGPNGCGKSNIADSVRWVLGEQSAKSMRGDKMNDVIFAGSADRRRVNMAEVTLVFDNTNHILNDDKDEIEVTRRLFRDSGEAEYLINRKNVRLKDVVDLFLDTGLGKDSLSIISQGNVLSFAEAKPLERSKFTFVLSSFDKDSSFLFLYFATPAASSKIPRRSKGFASAKDKTLP